MRRTAGAGRFLRPAAAIVLLALSLVWGAEPAAAVAFAVNSTADVVDLVPGDGSCDTGNLVGLDPECTLRAAIQEANALGGADVITLPAGTYTLSVGGNGEDAAAAGDLDVTSDITINGAGAATTIIQAGTTNLNGIDRVFEVLGAGGALDLSGVTVRYGQETDGAAIMSFGDLTVEDAIFAENTGQKAGGAIYQTGSGSALTVRRTHFTSNSGDDGGAIAVKDATAVVEDSAFTGNTASRRGGGFHNDSGVTTITGSTFSSNSALFEDGGGILNRGGGANLTVTNSTLSGNSAVRNGGGISVENTTTLLNVTITGNSAGNAGGGVRVQSGPLNTKNTIVAGNTTGGNCSNSMTSQGYNLEDTNTCGFNQPGDKVNANALLGPLQDNGGVTKTHALLAGSDAIDTGTDSGAPAFDQRGVSRPADGDGDLSAVTDIGAYEAQPTPIAPSAIWRRSGQSTPYYDRWDGSAFTGTLASQGVGSWRIIQGAESPSRDEAVLLGVDGGTGDVTGEMWTGGSWSPLSINPLGNMSQTYWWGFDIAYEPVSGDAVVVSTDGGSLKSWVWDGTSWTGPSNLTLPVAGTPRHLQLAAHPYADEMVLIVSNGNSQDYAFVWDGSTWGNSITLDAAGSGDRSDIHVAYEQQSGNALVVYGKGAADLHYRRWTGSNWDVSESTLTGIGGGYARWTTLGADPGSNRIALGVLTNDNDVWLAMWNGSAWINQTTATTDSTGTTEPAMAVAFEGTSGQALATYGEPANTPRYRIWTSGSGWGGELSAPSIGAQPNSQMLYAEPGTDGVMLAVNDDLSDLHYLFWNGSSWGVDNELETDTGETKNQPFVFLWPGATGSPPPNSPPTDVSLVPAAVAENVAVGTVVGVLSTSDPDPGDSHSYALVAGVGDGENGLFTIVGDELRTAAALDFETLGSPLSVRVESTDDGAPNLSFEKALTVTLTDVNEAPVLDPIGARSGDEGLVIGFTATASDADVPANTLVFTLEDGAGGVPVGASITGGGVFTWTPSEAQGPGIYTFDVVVTDDGTPSLEDRETVTVTVNEVNEAPVLDPIGARSGDEGLVIGFTATASDADVPANTLVFTLEDGAGSVPVGASITGGGVFTWTPSEAQGPGIYTFDVVVIDDGTPSLEDRETVTVTVNEVNEPPVADPVAAQIANEGDVVALVATAIDPDTPANSLSWTLDSGPGLVDGAGNYSWATSEVDGPGTYTVVLRVTDDGVPSMSETVAFDVTVAEVNEAPVLDPIGARSGDEGLVIGFTATASDADVPANTLVFTLEDGAGSVPVGASITGGGVFTWTPSEAQGPGLHIFDVVVTDNTSLEDRQTVTVTVNESNTAPVLEPIPDQAGAENALLTFTAVANDIDLPMNTLTFTMSGAPPGASITTTGTFSWTPTEIQGPGTYTFDVTVTDDGSPAASDTETVTVTVTEQASGPALDPISDQTTDEGEPLIFVATAADPDLPADTLTFSLAGPPAGASIDAVAGAFGWTPSESQGPGVYVFDVVVTDEGGLEDRQAVTVTVEEVASAPTVADPGDQVDGEGLSVNLAMVGSDPDVPSDSPLWSAAGLPPGLSINEATGLIAGTIGAGSAAGSPYEVIVRISDASDPLLSSETGFVWTITPNQPPSAANDFYEVDRGGRLEVAAPGILENDFDPGGDPLAVTLRVPTSNGALTLGEDGSFTYLHGGGSNFEDVFVYEVTDGRGGSSLATVKISIENPNLPPVLAADVFLLREDEVGVFAPLANDSDPEGGGLALVGVTNPEIGVLSQASSTEIGFHPPADFHGEVKAGYTAVDDFGNTAAGIITFIVEPINDIPLGVADSMVVNGYTPILIDVLANDRDVDGDTLRVVRILDVTHGEAELTADGMIAYRAAGGFVGTETFQYEVTDGAGGVDVATITVTVPARVLAAAIDLGLEIGSPTLEVTPPPANLNTDPAPGIYSTEGVRLLADAFFQSLGALRLPIFFLGLAVGIVIVLGAFTELPVLLANRRRRYYAVALLDRESRLIVREEPAADSPSIYFYEPTAAGIRSLDRARKHDGAAWIPVESPDGAGWVEAQYLTEAVDLKYFLEDKRPVAVLERLAEDFGRGRGVSDLFSGRGLAVALTNDPEFVSAEVVRDALTGRGGSLASRELRADVLDPLTAALRASSGVDAGISHSETALIPVELWNFQYLAVHSPGHPPWLVYFEYEKGKPKIVGVGLDV